MLWRGAPIISTFWRKVIFVFAAVSGGGFTTWRALNQDWLGTALFGAYTLYALARAIPLFIARRRDSE